MKKSSMLLFLAVVIALIVSACAPASVPSGGGQPVPSGAKATKTPAAQPADNQPSSGHAADLLDLKDVTEGLSSLNSYESTFTMSFKGADSGQPKEWTWTIDEQFVKNPPAKHSTMSSQGTDASGQNTTIETIAVNGKTYSKFGDVCASSDAGEAPTANTGFTPSSVIGDIKTAQLLGTDDINGVSAQHYAVDLSNLTALGAYTNAKSEVWIAQSGHFVVKYRFEATGKDTFFSGGAEGTIKWTYELKSVNQPIVIEPPKDCGGAPADIPVMDDAANQSAFGAMTTYTSATAFDTVVKFNQKEMVAKGWAAQEGGLSADGFTVLTFTKDKRTASITITADKDKNVTSVVISVEAAQ